jgi:hypothetical protein
MQLLSEKEWCCENCAKGLTNRRQASCNMYYRKHEHSWEAKMFFQLSTVMAWGSEGEQPNILMYMTVNETTYSVVMSLSSFMKAESAYNTLIPAIKELITHCYPNGNLPVKKSFANKIDPDVYEKLRSILKTKIFKSIEDILS